MWKTRSSVRNPSFFGPFALCFGLLAACCFSEPFWQNFFLIESNSVSLTGNNYTAKVGSWGLCVRLTNSSAASAVGNQTSWCTSLKTGFTLNLNVNNTAGETQWPHINDDATLFGLASVPGTTPVSILTAASTSEMILHPIAAVMAVLTVVSLAIPVKDMPLSLQPLQKSGMIPIALGITSFILALTTFCIDIALVIPALAKLNAIEGVSANWGPVMWFVLPSAILMIPALLSVFLRASTGYTEQIEQQELMDGQGQYTGAAK